MMQKIKCKISKLFETYNLQIPKARENEGTESFRALWPFFWFSRLIGLCPISNHGSNLVSPKMYSPCWFPTYISMLILIVQTSAALYYLLWRRDINELIDYVSAVFYWVQLLSACIFMSWKSREIPKFLEACKRIDGLWKKYQSSSDGLVRDSWLLFGFFFVTQLLDIVLYYFTVAKREYSVSWDDYTNEFRVSLFGDWGFYSGTFSLLSEVYCSLGWNFGDTVIGLMSLILGRYFLRMNRVLAEQGPGLTLAKLEDLRRDHMEICRLVQHCNELFSPLILMTYAGNLTYLLARLYVSLEIDLKHSHFLVWFKSIYGFFQQIVLKIFLPSYLAAQLNERAHEGMDLVNDWPSSIHQLNTKYRLLLLGRFISHFEVTQIGLSGMNYFTITKSFIVGQFSGLLTYEVFILQFEAAGGGGK